ncbi:hypothetical protein CGRA01v4_02447 [Colletotrichum graminicola]|nr:hypothetical protein CGRA01v4_02447 [Colletotrichum graminicola]
MTSWLQPKVPFSRAPGTSSPVHLGAAGLTVKSAPRAIFVAERMAVGD